MKKISNVKMVMMTVNEIQQKCKHDEANRCYVVDGAEAVKMGYSFSDGKKAKTRIARCNKAIKNGWSVCCHMVVHKVGEQMYLSEGQGRFEAVLKANRESEMRGEAPKYTEIPVLLVERDSIEEMRQDIRDMNTFNTNWTISDSLHCDAVTEGGEKAVYYNIIRRYQDELGVSCDYIPRIILFGNHKHSRNDLSNLKMRENTDFVVKVFKKFYAAQDTRASKKLRDKAKRSDVALALNSIIDHLINACGYENPEIYEEVVENAVTKLCNAVKRLNDDEYVRTISGNSAYVGQAFMDMICSRNRNKYIQKACGTFYAAKYGQYVDVA